jgi:hypothetical protein
LKFLCTMLLAVSVNALPVAAQPPVTPSLEVRAGFASPAQVVDENADRIRLSSAFVISGAVGLYHAENGKWGIRLNEDFFPAIGATIETGALPRGTHAGIMWLIGVDGVRRLVATPVGSLDAVVGLAVRQSGQERGVGACDATLPSDCAAVFPPLPSVGRIHTALRATPVHSLRMSAELAAYTGRAWDGVATNVLLYAGLHY